MPRPPDRLKAFAKHGALLTGAPPELRGDCPICGSASRRPFCVNSKTQAWNCKACGQGGGVPEFLAAVMGRYQRAFQGPSVLELERQRGIPRGALRRWGVGWAAHVRSWALPQRLAGAVCNVSLWRPAQGSLATKGAASGLSYAWGSADPLTDEEVCWVCEGEWDAMTIDHVLRTVRAPGAVVGVAGSGSLPRELVNALVDKHVVLAYDCDEGGRSGLSRARKVLEPGCASVTWIEWPEGTPDGRDVRDVWLASGRKTDVAHKLLTAMLARPGGAADPARAPAAHAGSPAAPKGRGLSRRGMIAGFRRWLHLPDPTVLDVVFGTAFANRVGGHPVWVFLVGPPGCGKTVPIQALFGSPLVAVADVMTPASLVSGSQAALDPSQIPKWRGKVVAMKDFTTVLSLPQMQREEVFGYLRASSDGRIDKTFGNGVERHYRNCRFGVIAGVTPEIERHGPTHSVLGERFLRYRVRDKLTIAAGSTAIDMALDVVDKREEDLRESELAEVARATLDRKIGDDEWPRIGAGLKKMFRRLAQWTASMRGAVARDKYARGDQLDYAPQAEIGTRIAEQLAKLAMGVAILRRRRVVGLEEFKIAIRVARDSAPDLVEKVTKALWLRRDSAGRGAESVKNISEWTRLPRDTVERVLQDGWLLRVFRRAKPKGATANHWGISHAILKLMEPLDLFTDEGRFRRVE